MTLLPSPPRPGDLVDNRYHVLRELGRGSFGVIFEAEDKVTREPVALKFLLPRMAANPKIKERFVREAHLTSCLTSPNAVHIHDYGEYSRSAGGTTIPYMALEILDGVDLSEWLASQPEGRASLPVAMGILCQALNGLTQAHRMGIVHRDIKPENLYLHKDDRGIYQVKLVDFGMAKAIAGGWEESATVPLTGRGDVLGTPAYMAPEQAQAFDNLTEAVDVYAMACVGFELIAGELPYMADKAPTIAIMHITSPIPDLPGLDPSHPLVPVFRKGMAKEAMDRYSDAGLFHEALKSAMDEADIQPEAPIWDPRGHEHALVDLDELGDAPLVDSLRVPSFDERATTRFKARPKPETSRPSRHTRQASEDAVTTIYDARAAAKTGKEEVTSMMYYEPPEDDEGGSKPWPLPLLILVGGVAVVVGIALMVLLMVVLAR